MKSKVAFLASALGLALLGASTAIIGAPSPKVPPVSALMVPFDYLIDLETGLACAPIGLPGLPCTSPGDFAFAFNATSPLPTALFQRYPAQIALLSNVPFAAVDVVAVTNGIVFTDDLQEVPFGPNDTAILHTVEGNYFKVGLALCFVPDPGYPGCAPVGPTGAFGVRFQYQQLR